MITLCAGPSGSGRSLALQAMAAEQPASMPLARLSSNALTQPAQLLAQLQQHMTQSTKVLPEPDICCCTRMLS